MNKQINIPHWLVYLGLFFAACLFVFLFSCTTSPLYEHHPFWFHGDSGIFQEMGVCLLQGGIPYIDLFDHKGPILWYIQALGIWINPCWGLMALQSVSLFCTLMIWYKSSLILSERQISSFLTVFSGFVFLLAFYERGNLCDEWSLPFISLSIFLYLKRWKTSTKNPSLIYNHTDTLIIGLCVGILAMIKLNNTAPIIGFVIWHYIICIKLKEYKHLWIDIAMICIGIIVIFILCSSFFFIKASWNGVYEMIYGTFIHNFLYFKNTHFLPLKTYLTNYLPHLAFLIIIIICLFFNKSYLNIGIPLILSFIVTIIAIGRFAFSHYMMIFIPLFITALALIICTSKYWLYIILTAILIYALRVGYDALDHLAFRLMGKKTDTEINDGFHRFIESIPPIEQKSIYNAGLKNMGAGLFANEKIYQCNRIIYSTHLESSPHLQEYIKTHGIKELQPIWILTQSQKPEATDEYMRIHYTLSDSILGGQFEPIWCWKRNE